MHHANDKVTDVLNTDEVAIIFSFLPHQDIMRARVCRAWREGATKTKTLVPPTEYVVDSNNVASYNAMRAMSTALPNLQWIEIFNSISMNGLEPQMKRLQKLTSTSFMLSIPYQTSQSYETWQYGKPIHTFVLLGDTLLAFSTFHFFET